MLYGIRTVKQTGSDEFSNQYKIDAPNAAAAYAAAANLLEAERAVFYQDVLMLKARVSAIPDPTRNNFVDIATNGTGARSLAGVAWTPFVLCGVVSFNPMAGSLGKKMLRRTVNANDCTGFGEDMHVGTSSATWSALNAFGGAALGAIGNAGCVLLIGKLNRNAVGGEFYGLVSRTPDNEWHNRKKKVVAPPA